MWYAIRRHQQLVLGRLSISEGSVALEDAPEDASEDAVVHLPAELVSRLAGNLPEPDVQCRHQSRCVRTPRVRQQKML